MLRGSVTKQPCDQKTFVHIKVSVYTSYEQNEAFAMDLPLQRSGYIYLAMTREFIQSGEPVVKAGRTADPNRIKGYGKGAMYLLFGFVSDMFEAEKSLLGVLATRFTQRLDLGREYFEGDVLSMKAVVHSYLSSIDIADSSANHTGFLRALAAAKSLKEDATKNAKDNAKRATHAVDSISGEEVEDQCASIDDAPEAGEPRASIDNAPEAGEPRASIDDAPVAGEPCASTVDVPNATSSLQHGSRPAAIDPERAIMNFYDSNAQLLVGTIASRTVVSMFLEYTLSNSIRTCVKHDRLIRFLCKMYGAKTSTAFSGEEITFASTGTTATATATNKLHEFLAMDDVERGCRITMVNGSVVWVEDLKRIFEATMTVPFVVDHAVLRAFGFSMSNDRLNVCYACKQIAKVRGGACCEVYARMENRARRGKKSVVMNMLIQMLT